MSTLKAKIVASALIASLATGIAAPASAATYGYGYDNGYGHARELRQDIAQLDRQIDRLQARHVLSYRAANRFERKVERLEDNWRYFARGGFTRGELRELDNQIDAVRYQLRQEAREGRGDNYRGDYRSDNRRDDDRNYNDHDDGGRNGNQQQSRDYRQR